MQSTCTLFHWKQMSFEGGVSKTKSVLLRMSEIADLHCLRSGRARPAMHRFSIVPSGSGSSASFMQPPSSYTLPWCSFATHASQGVSLPMFLHSVPNPVEWHHFTTLTLQAWRTSKSRCAKVCGYERRDANKKTWISLEMLSVNSPSMSLHP